MPPPDSSHFQLVISSLDDFIAFCAVIRGVDLLQLQTLIAQLNAGTASLADAVSAAQPSLSPKESHHADSR